MEKKKKNLTQRTQRKSTEFTEKRNPVAQPGMAVLTGCDCGELGFAEVEEFWTESKTFGFAGGVENSYHEPDDAGPFGPVLQAE